MYEIKKSHIHMQIEVALRPLSDAKKDKAVLSLDKTLTNPAQNFDISIFLLEFWAI